MSEVPKENVKSVLDFDTVYSDFVKYYNDHYDLPLWKCDEAAFQEVMRLKLSVTRKEKAFLDLLNDGKKLKDDKKDDGATVNRAALIRLLSGGSLKTDKVFPQISSDEAENVSLGMDEESFEIVAANLDDDGELLRCLRKIYDWSLLEEILAGKETLSEAKVEIYNIHKKDLVELKAFVRKYIPEKYGEIFRARKDIPNYAAYTGHDSLKRCKREEFLDYIKKQVSVLSRDSIESDDLPFYDSMLERIENKTFLPKQVNGDNRVIPYQLYWVELNQILNNARNYLPFLSESDSEGYTNADKILSTFEFRIPYYVGPLNTHGTNSWMKRKEGAVGKIYPWNFKSMVDEEASEGEFIRRMTNQCTYLPGKDVLPKNSFLYTRYTVLNEINNICVNGQKISVEIKQLIFSKLQEKRNLSKKQIEEILKANGCMNEGDVLSGIDTKINSSLTGYHAFKNAIKNNILTEKDAEKIILQLAYSDDKSRLKSWLENRYPGLSEEDNRYFRNLKLKDFGRFSREFLSGIEGINKETGEVTTIIDALWNTNDNLMQLLSDRYTFAEEIEKFQQDFYENKEMSIDDILDDLYVSNSVRRPIYRTLAILKDIRKATKKEPTRIFIEMARGGQIDKKRTKSRRDQITEYYSEITEDTRELSKLLESKTDNELQSETLYLYFMQLGRCMYSGEPIDINLLKTDMYNVDHIYPQCKVKDDSISNKVLVLSKLNGDKGDKYPLNPEWQKNMATFWKTLLNHKMISEEKYHRLTRMTAFTEEELTGFINRQLVETRQSTKALATVLQAIYPNTKIVYSKAGVVSDFRKEYGMLKCRSVNDLHHGKDAYLNIVCGNVYYCKFTKPMEERRFSFKQDYSMKTTQIFTHEIHDGDVKIWDEHYINNVKKVMSKDNLHYTRFAFERKGGLFDQMPVSKGNGAVPRKENLSIDKYGGYNKSTASFYLLVKYQEKKKTDIMIMPVDLYYAENVMRSEESAKEYARKNIAKILEKDERDISITSLPLSLRKIKINTIFSIDGYKMALTGKMNGGTRVVYTTVEPLLLKANELYVKKLENFVNKKSEKRVSKIDTEYDLIDRENNIKLYDILLKKAESEFLGKKLQKAIPIIKDGRNKVGELSLEDQCDLLMHMIELFKTGRSGGVDLQLIGGSKQTAAVNESSNLSNWKKCYKDVRVIDYSASGIYQTESENLLELL